MSRTEFSYLANQKLNSAVDCRLDLPVREQGKVTHKITVIILTLMTRKKEEEKVHVDKIGPTET